MTEKLYHITPIENMASIQQDGLKAGEDGYIYFIIDKKVAGLVAKNQCFLDDSFSLFEVDKKYLSSELEPDNVGELTAEYQRRIHQDYISPDGITFAGNYFIDHEAINKIYQSFITG